MLKPEMNFSNVFQKSKKNKRFNTVNRLSRLNENVLSPNRFEQLTVEDDVKESANVKKRMTSPTITLRKRQLKNHTLVKLT